MRLELITNHPSNIHSDMAPVLFVHGMWHGAWCWESNLMPYFESKGIKAYAMSLSNHGGSHKRKPFNLLRIADYVKDVEEIVQSLDQKPILIGHSMGGYIVQKYLETNSVMGAVLMASVPPKGVWGATIYVLTKMPWTFTKANLTLHLKYIVDSVKKYKRLFCSEEFSDEAIRENLEKINNESYLAYLDMLGLNPVHPDKITTPLLIMGGGKDVLVTRKMVMQTAEKYNSRAVIFEDLPHMMMLAKDYKIVGDRIIRWMHSIHQLGDKSRDSE